MYENNHTNPQQLNGNDSLVTPQTPNLTPWRKFWLVLKTIQARLRFVAILVAIGFVITYWDTLKGHYDKWTRHQDTGQPTVNSDTEYFCPMHPQIIRDNDKEKCPICFMPLSKRKKGDGKEEPLRAGTVSRVQLAPYRVALAGVQTSEVTYQHLAKEIQTVGFVEFDERKQTHIAARVKGRIDKLYVNVTGQMVSPGDELASLYSPDLVTTVQNLVDAQRSGNRDLQNSARSRLRLWDIDEKQIDEILRTGTANMHLKIRSPIHGHIIKKYQVEGKYVDEGAPLYDVADLSSVWIQAQIYENDLALLKEGQQVSAMTPAYPNRVFTGRVAFIHPHLDRDTRTLTVRYDMENPDHELRPGMYATVKVKIPATELDLFTKNLKDDWRNRTATDLLLQALLQPEGLSSSLGAEALLQAAMQASLLRQGLVLTVPESAVIDTGTRKIVYREASQGVYEGIEVQLGPRADASYPVVRGLEPGDRVVTAGSFLIDAETRLNPAAGSIYFGGSGTKTDKSVTAMRPSTITDEDTEVVAARAKLKPQDRRLVEMQDVCPILEDNRLGSMGPPVKIIIQGQPVFLCCPGCKKEALAHPDETLAKVEKLKAKTRAAKQ